MRLIHSRYAKRKLFAVAAVLIISWGIFLGKVLAASVTASWSYDYGPMPACSQSRTANCIDHFEVLDITDQKKTVVIQSVSNPKGAAGKIDKISTDFKYGPPFGQHTISVVAIGHDANGIRISSDPSAARVMVVIRPSARMSLLF